MPIQITRLNTWMRSGDQVTLRDGREVLVEDAFDQTHDFYTIDSKDNKVPAVGETDDIFIGQDIETGKKVISSATEVVAVVTP